MNRAETIEGTAEMVSARDGKGIAIQTDHLIPQQVAALIEGIAAEQDGCLDLLVNDIWGCDDLAQWVVPVLEA